MLSSGSRGSMASSEVESIIRRNSEFLAVVRAGDGDGRAGVYNAVTGQYYGGLQPGRVPEWSHYRDSRHHDGSERKEFVRGWRNLMYDLLAQGRLRPTKEIVMLLGREAVIMAKEYGLVRAPMTNPNEPSAYQSIRLGDK